MNKDELMNVLTTALQESFDSVQSTVDPFVVAYYDKDDKLIGYHADSFCNLTQNIMDAKRYSGDNPYPQLAIIQKNLASVMSCSDSKPHALLGLFKKSKSAFGNRSLEDIHIDAEYLGDDAPKQKFRFKIIEP